MKTSFIRLSMLLFTTVLFSQTGHIMQGIGAVNMSMGGASTAQPLDISGAMHWNPASISTFDAKIIRFDLGLFFSSPELSASLPEGALFQAGPGSPASPPVFGTTQDERPTSVLPALAMVWGKENSRHTFGASVFGISGFGVTFPEETNLPFDALGNPNPSWDPNNSNPINWPQTLRGFGAIESDYRLLQVGFTWAYELSDKLSLGVQPTFNYANLELMPNPTANPTAAGYPSTDKSSATGFGAQFGIFYDSNTGFKVGASFKTQQVFSDFEFENTHLDGATSKNSFNMDYPAILSFGLGYSKKDIDVALDYRFIDYESTDGFSETGWTSTASVAGFGWENVSVISAGIQYKGIRKVPVRLGYTYSSNPIKEEVAFFNIPATAIIKNAVQLGLTYEATDNLYVDAVFHYGTSGEATKGQILDPMQVTPTNPLGAIPGTSVSYDMTTAMFMVGINYRFKK